MNVQQLTDLLESNSESSLRLVLPSGAYVPEHFHVTEVGRIDKNFIDCGGTQRKSSACLVQTWTANDLDHRLTAGKLAKIIRLAEPILASNELVVEIEYGADVAAHYTINAVAKHRNQLLVTLAGKQTDCLAKDQCGAGECSTSGCCQ